MPKFTQPSYEGAPWVEVDNFNDDGQFTGVSIGVKDEHEDRLVCIVPSRPDEEGCIDDLVHDDEDRANIRLIKRAPKMYHLITELIRACPEIGTDREVSGADAIEALNPIWPQLRRLIRDIDKEKKS